MSSAKDLSISTDRALPFDSVNPNGTETVLFVHGAFSSAREWDAVTKHIPPELHILLPDLPAHGRGTSIAPFSVPTASELVATLIRAHAKDGRTHLVGLSLGAHVVAHFASHHPELTLTVFASGFKILTRSMFSPVLPTMFFGMQSATKMLPRSLVRRFMDGADGPAPQKGVLSRALCAEVIRVMTDAEADIGPIPARTLVVAAAKSGVVPSGDSVPDAERVVHLVREGEGCKESRGVRHEGMRHPWNGQDPELFASAVVAWIESKELPEGFVDL